LGRPLPPGRARVFRRETDGGLTWLGEDEIGATGVGQAVRLRLAPATGLKGERKQLGFTTHHALKRIVEEIEVTLSNDTDAAVEVTVLERMARGDTWNVAWASAAASKEDPRTVRFDVKVAAKGKQKLRYRVIYTWP